MEECFSDLLSYHNRAQAVKRAREDGETIIPPEIPKRRAS